MGLSDGHVRSTPPQQGANPSPPQTWDFLTPWPLFALLVLKLGQACLPRAGHMARAWRVTHRAVLVSSDSLLGCRAENSAC